MLVLGFVGVCSDAATTVRVVVVLVVVVMSDRYYPYPLLYFTAT